MHRQALTGAWEYRRSGKDEWSSANVPGSIHTDLMASGCIPDPFVADNEKRVHWVAESDWVYRHSFNCSAELLAHQKILLVCDGLDTLATIVLNGHELGHTDNMFRKYEWEVNSFLDPKGANDLTIIFSSPVKYAAEKQALRPLPGVAQAIPGGSHLRKAPCRRGPAHSARQAGPRPGSFGSWF